MTTAAVLLAAGGGSRFKGERHKLLTRFRGRPLVAWAIDAAASAGLDDLLVVTGDTDLSELLPPTAIAITNQSWRDGVASSLRVAVDATQARGHDAMVIGLGDQPLVITEAWRAVAASGAVIAVATYDGERRHPVRLDRSVWPMLPRQGDVGARLVMAERPDLVCEVPCRGGAADVDTVEDLERWS